MIFLQLIRAEPAQAAGVAAARYASGRGLCLPGYGRPGPGPGLRPVVGHYR